MAASKTGTEPFKQTVSGRSLMLRLSLFAVCALVLAPSLNSVSAAPIPPPVSVPSSDDIVLERLASWSWERPIASRSPATLEDSLVQARLAIERGRRASDARQFGQAEALLQPWAHLPAPPAELRVLRSALARWRHAFDAARIDLDAAIAATPSHSQARLDRANLNLVQGRIAEARTDCEKLAALAPTLVAHVCLAAAEASAGRLEASYRRLRVLLATQTGGAVDEKIWAIGLSADLAERLGHDAEAEQLYREALNLGQGKDLPTQLALADLYLRQERGGEVLELLRHLPDIDTVLLRRAAASASDVRKNLLDQVEESLQADQRRNGTLHLREATQLALLRGDAGAALELASANWRDQREPLDVLLLAQAAHAAGKPGLPEVLQRWIQDNGYVDRRLDTPRETSK